MSSESFACYKVHVVDVSWRQKLPQLDKAFGSHLFEICWGDSWLIALQIRTCEGFLRRLWQEGVRRNVLLLSTTVPLDQFFLSLIYHRLGGTLFPGQCLLEEVALLDLGSQLSAKGVNRLSLQPKLVNEGFVIVVFSLLKVLASLPETLQFIPLPFSVSPIP